MSQHDGEKADVMLLQSTCPAGAGGGVWETETGSVSTGIFSEVSSRSDI